MRSLVVVIFVVAYFVSLVIMAPASLLDDLVHFYTQDRLVLANARGTIWQGSAVPALRMQDGHLIAIRPLRWNIYLLPLLRGEIRARMQWEESLPAAATGVLVSGGLAELNNLFIPLPARLLNDASPILKPAEFRGQMEVRSQRLVFSSRGIEGAAVVDWLHAGSALSSIDPLGNYRFLLDCAGNTATVDLSTTSGILVLAGHGQWSGSGGLEFRGQASASPGNQERLNELLHHLGPEQSQGVFTFRLTSKQ